MRIFLSYQNERGPFVRDIKQHLPEHVRPWIAEKDLLIGEDIPFSIRKAINDTADFVILFVDTKAVKSKWVQQELEWALKRENALERPFVLPIVLDRAAWTRVEPSLGLRKYIECYRFEEADARFVANELTYQLFAWLSRDVERLRGFVRILTDNRTTLETAYLERKYSAQNVDILSIALMNVLDELATDSDHRMLKEGLVQQRSSQDDVSGAHQRLSQAAGNRGR